MSIYGWLQAGVFFALVLALTKPLGLYMARVFSGERTWLSPVLRAGRTRLLPPLPDRSQAREMNAPSLSVRDLRLQRRRAGLSLRLAAHRRSGCRSTRKASTTSRPTWPGTRPSAS